VLKDRRDIRGKLYRHSILMSLLKDLESPVLSLRRLLRSLLLIYNQKHARNPQYGLSLHPNHVRKLLSSSFLLCPNHLLDHLLDHLLLPYSPRASCRPINGS
jgi:hypothetical protein